MNECYKCGFWDSEREGCACSSYDIWYACPIENKKPENVKALKEYAERLYAQQEEKMKTLEDLILFHNSDQRAQIYNRVANIVFNEFGYHVNNSEIALCCSYVVNKMIEDGRLKVNDNQRINESGYIATNE